MIRYAIKKAFHLLIVLFGVSVLTFVFTSWIQGNPAEIVMSQSGIDPTRGDIEALEKEMGLDENLVVQYTKWIGNVVKLDFGSSYITGKPVLEEIMYRVPPTLQLTVCSFLLMVFISVTVGIVAVVKNGSAISSIIDAVTFIVMGVPGFVLGLILAYVVSVRLGLLPMVGNKTAAHAVLPVITLALPMSCRYIRLIKSNLLEVLDEDYIFLLRTKGIRESVIMFSNAMRNAFIPVINLMGISLGGLFGGSVVVESIFSWPGLGSYLIASINNRDYPVILAYVVIMSVVFVIINYIVDMLVCALDPRISFREGKNL